MGRLFKYLLYAFGALVALLIVAAISFLLLFDANDFREEIAEGVEEATGRTFSIDGDLSVSLFPWLAIEIGSAELGNAEGFGDEPFASFERARLSVRLLPLLLRRDISIGTAELESLRINLEVREDGLSNWQDLADRQEAAAEAEAPAESATGSLDVGNIEVSNAAFSYTNAQLDEQYTLTNLNMTTGSVSPDEPIEFDGSFEFSAQPADISGRVEMGTVVEFAVDDAMIMLREISIEGSTDGSTDGSPQSVFAFAAPYVLLRTEDRIAELDRIELSVLGVDIRADVEPFSYADSPTPTATIAVDAFSPRSLMQALDVEVPPTADPGALGKLIIDAKAVVTDSTVQLTALELVLDDTTFKGELVVPRDSDGIFRLDLAADSINVDRYMAPVEDAAASRARGEAIPTEIPVDLIRALKARGSLTITEVQMSGLLLENVQLELNSSNGRLRMHPISAQIYDGEYNGDIRIDASDNTAVLSVNEQIRNVNLGSLAQAMFEQDNITGQINGSFVLSGRGNDMVAIQRSLSGDMSFVLSDGTWEGTDVWYEIRRARALFKREQAPEPRLPARTPFSEVRGTGTVTNGVMKNEDFYAALPFLELRGRGTVDFPTATTNYSLSGRVFDQPASAGATPEEIADLTKAVIPLKITGPLADPDISVDIEALLKERVNQELRDRVFGRLLGGDDEDETVEGEAVEGEAVEGEAVEGEAVEGEEEPEEQDIEEQLEDELEDALKDIFNR